MNFCNPATLLITCISRISTPPPSLIPESLLAGLPAEPIYLPSGDPEDPPPGLTTLIGLGPSSPPLLLPLISSSSKIE